MTFETEFYQTKPEVVWAARLHAGNMQAAADESGAIFHHTKDRAPYLELKTLQGKVKAWSGMWLVYNGKIWLAMTDANFHKKYEDFKEPSE